MRQLDHAEVANEKRRFPLRLLCANWTDPLNVGSIFRLADATGLAGLILAGTTPRPPNRRISRTARSTVAATDWTGHDDPVGYLRGARAAGAYVLALEVTDESECLYEFALPPAVATGEAELVLVAGAEAGGVGAELLRECDGAVALPMYGQNTSLNVAVAVGAAVYLLLGKFRE